MGIRWHYKIWTSLFTGTLLIHTSSKWSSVKAKKITRNELQKKLFLWFMLPLLRYEYFWHITWWCPYPNIHWLRHVEVRGAYKRSHMSECMFEHQNSNVCSSIHRSVYTSEVLSIHWRMVHTSELRCMVAKVSFDGHRRGCFSGCWCIDVWLRFYSFFFIQYFRLFFTYPPLVAGR